jgi:(p)ppGpp synthase/HD superfamily hydrolase
MIFSTHIREAIKLALKTHEIHQKQKRKGKDVPYIVHPLIVGMLLSRVGAPDDVVAAGIIHDTIEDAHPLVPVTRAVIQKKFNDRIADLVMSVTENKRFHEWEARKRESIERIQVYSPDSLLIKSADALANITELVHDIDQDGMKVFARFGGREGAVLTHYCQVVNAIGIRSAQFPKGKKNPFLSELRDLQKTLRKYKDALGVPHCTPGSVK